jgi:hypothetical protein
MSDAPAKDSAPSPPAPAATGTGNAHAKDASAAETSPRDIVFLGPPTADGAGVHVLRAREERIEAGELRAIQEGKPITGEIVSLAPRKDNPRVCDVKDSYRPPAMMSHKGPAKVADDAYRDGWDEVFGNANANANAKKPKAPPSAAN